MNAAEAILNATLRMCSEPDFDPSGIPDVEGLFDQLREYRAQLSVGHPLKEVTLPDEIRPVRPVRAKRSFPHRKFRSQV
jgi:hypothetical protein